MIARQTLLLCGAGAWQAALNKGGRSLSLKGKAAASVIQDSIRWGWGRGVLASRAQGPGSIPARPGGWGVAGGGSIRACALGA